MRDIWSSVLFSLFPIRLRLRLAGGEVDLVRRVLWPLRAELSKTQQRFSVAREDRSEGKRELDQHHNINTARTNYAEVMGTLIVQIMLPSGESADALSLVTSDPHLELKQKSLLMETCAASAATRSRELKPRDGSGPIDGRYSSESNRGDVGGQPGAQELAASHEREGPAEQTMRPVGSAGSLFSGFSELTPEARIVFLFAAGAAGLATYAACRRRQSLWRAVRNAAGLARRTAGDLGTFIVGS